MSFHSGALQCYYNFLPFLKWSLTALSTVTICVCLINFINGPSENKIMGYNGEHNKTEKMKDLLEWVRIHCSGWSKNESENKELVKLLRGTWLPLLFLNGRWVKRLKYWFYHITGLFVFLCILVSCNTCNQIISGNNSVFSGLLQMGTSIPC